MHIVESGSIIKAAKTLEITKAAASKHLIDLEQELNTTLLIRNTRTLRLTEIGSQYYLSLKNIFSLIHESENNITESQQSPSGTIRIVSQRHFAYTYILKYISEFIQLYPNLKVDLELVERFDLEKEGVDVFFGIDYEGPDMLVRREIAKITPILCASKYYLQKFGIPKNINDLKSHRYVSHSSRDQDYIINSNNQNLYVEPYMKINDLQAMLQVVLQDIGIVKLHNYLVEDYLHNGTLIEILPEYKQDAKSVYIYYRQQKIIQPKIRHFLDFMYKKMKIT